ncbi:MAG: DNA primase [Candidatus Dactylopiibacterium carminicum]|uniref:DNA primase n=1 Tax=Candidatus Dactylopiibacterium carminicum TaxID=857335 RepID=A0A272EX47_9RHOO|nr:DNA primase [Candidatus Dactylopiibacterium carminicum]KAF7600255.1 DNA primase [Candidatus Dactylopiibacterium carminicum]PAS94693.1 MAG: DNA primase [Candidatus Dactylopiibacterium carminicum]PAS96980.1 MAG: DNA primase [Candidatus Dactylopiibacterium carminicum]PAT00254.1 MAG: DNA primase [Candidatus Dactylopiibacterium carminicum]
MIPESFIQEVLARTDIVGLIERYVPLKKGGANYMACCPFHNEKSPSFTVSPTKQFYHCFGCGAHGTAVGFLMEYCGMSFRDAITDLAQQAGLQLPAENAPQVGRSQLSSLHEATERATRYFRDQLRHAPQAIEYLRQRGLTGEIAKRFAIGYAPDDWNALRQTFGSDYDSPALLEAGLVIQNDTGRRYDRFRDRIMFPIQDQRGNIIGFGGRVLGQGEPKYLNSPETPLFDKGRELYGLFGARQAIRESGVVVVVEGYMDVVALAQYGFGSAVATLGTATTATHIQKLFRQSEKVVFCFDGDNAGRKAARRALENSLDQLADDREVRFLFLPPEHDPDSYIRAEGLEAFQRAVHDAMPLSEFLLRELRGDLNLSIPEDRAKLVHEAKALIPRISAPILQLQTLRLLADDAQMDQTEVARALGLRAPAREGGKKRTAPRPSGPRKPPTSPQRGLLRLLASRPRLMDRLPGDIAELVGEGLEGGLLQAMRDIHDHHDLDGAALAALYQSSEDENRRTLLAELLSGEDLLPEQEADPQLEEQELLGFVTSLRVASLDQRFAALQQRLAAGERLSTEEMRDYATLPAQKQKLRAGQKPV